MKKCDRVFSKIKFAPQEAIFSPRIRGRKWKTVGCFKEKRIISESISSVTFER